MASILAAFITPNDPTIAKICKRAGMLLEKNGKKGALDGYQSKDPSRSYMLAAGIWSAIVEMGLTYAEPPASFEVTGQKIRSPLRIRNEGLATCLDSALLFAGALEATGLNPVVIFLQSHAFTGVWLTDKTLKSQTERDVVEIRKAIAAREFIAFETTLITSRPAIGFEFALKKANEYLSEASERLFDSAIDIRRSRFASITPLASHQVGNATMADTDTIEAPPLPPDPHFNLLPSEETSEDNKTPEGRIDRWQKKLLDLTLRNKLINFKDNKQSIPLLSPNLPKLENMLAEGHSLRIISIKEENPAGVRDNTLHQRRSGNNINDEFAASALERNQICVSLALNEMNNRLVTLYRKAKSEMEEGGANTLYLAAGFLKWKKEGHSQETYKAPILLLPVTLKRQSAHSHFDLVDHEDDVRINSTLLQFLKRDFEVNTSALEGELPTDEAGIDVPLIFDRMRQIIRDISGFEVIEDAALSTFSFAKYLMWKDLVDRTDDLRKNRLVSHLIDSPDTPFTQHCEGSCLPCPHDIDNRTSKQELLTPLPADGSQLAAIIAAMDGYDFVVIGPPGTGKSQTIANMIAQCLAVGKTILFVAEKSAALDVVYRRLKHYGLGDACLELHSNKAERKRVLRQLGEAWNRNNSNSNSAWQTKTKLLRDTRARLNRYVEQLHSAGSHGFSIYQAIGFVVKSSPSFTLSFDNLNAHDSTMFTRLEDTAMRTQRVYQHLEKIENFKGLIDNCKSIGETTWSFKWQNELLDKAKSLLPAISRLKQTAQDLAQVFGLPELTETTRGNISLLKKIVAIRKISSEQNFLIVIDAKLKRLEDAKISLVEAIGSIRQARATLVAYYENNVVMDIPLSNIEDQWRVANSKMWPFSHFARKRITKFLQSYVSEGVADVDKELQPLKIMKHNLEVVSSSALANLPVFKGEKTDSVQVSKYLKDAHKLQQSICIIRDTTENHKLFDTALQAILIPHNDNHEAVLKLEQFHSALHDYVKAQDEYIAHAKGTFGGNSIEEIQDELRQLIESKSQLSDWVQWVSVKNEAMHLGLTPLVDALREELVTDAMSEFRAAYFSWWLPLAMDTCSELRGFRHWAHEDLIKEFREHDNAVQDMASAQVVGKISHGLPARDGVPRKSELGTLKYQLSLLRPSFPIRKLIDSMPNTFRKLAPCVLMSPLSVAQYLPARARYDVIIFDEASQITTWDAVGAIARAKQSIIVGDPKQLPPTNFFGRSDEDDSDGFPEYEKDLPSILEEATAAGLPEIQLNWHYRSQDESLIAFSNHYYYGDRLITFPSPKTTSDALVFHKNEGIYTRGTSRTNKIEAQEIVDFATAKLENWLHLDERERPTLGIITFNTQQQELILNLFDKVRQSNSELEWYFNEEREEPVIVKNLENIQGDERDVMCFSITFGRDNAGKMSMAISALNRDGGEKRLNVAVTRARSEMHVFSSIRADDIDLSRTKALGVAHLKYFLNYAENGQKVLPQMDEGSLGDAESPFEEAVLTALREKGWEVRTQIGVSGFRIDLGIVHPDHAGAYLAGIECDGATYHSSACARDRDKIRESVLCNLGWSIIRIWSTDWFMNPRDALQRVHHELEELLRNSRESAQNSKIEAQQDTIGEANNDLDISNLPDDVDTETRIQCKTSQPSLQKHGYPCDISIKQFNNEFETTHRTTGIVRAGLTCTSENDREIADADTSTFLNLMEQLDSKRFFDSDYEPIISKMVNRLVETEGPIEFNRLSRIICKAHGWKKSGIKLKDHISTCLGTNSIRKEGNTEFIWAPGTLKKQIPFRLIPGRNIFEISRREILGLIAANPRLVTSEDRVRDLAQLLGIKRLSKKASEFLSDCLSTYFMRMGK